MISQVQDLQDMLLEVAKMHPEISIFEKNEDFRNLIFIDTDSQSPSQYDLLRMVNALLEKMTKIFAIKQNKTFLQFFGIGQDSVPAENSGNKRIVLPKSGSLLRQIVNN